MHKLMRYPFGYDRAGNDRAAEGHAVTTRTIAATKLGPIDQNMKITSTREYRPAILPLV